MIVAMHMADGLLSVPVGLIFFVLILVALFFVLRNVKKEGESKIPAMAVMGAFVFAAQMINFTIPGTGSSGHICGGILLSIILGPAPAFLSMCVVLAIQCLLFGDGGLLALGCNIFNMALIPTLIVYPLLVRPILNKGLSSKRIALASVLGCVVSLELGAFGVCVETMLSHITALPFTTFASLMLPIHLAIGLVEGIITSAVVIYVHRTSPSMIEGTSNQMSKKGLITMAVAVAVIAGGLSYLASSHPDGLEWSIEKVTGSTEVSNENKTKEQIEKIQSQIALLPDYMIGGKSVTSGGAGLIGAGAVLIVVGALGMAVVKKRHE